MGRFDTSVVLQTFISRNGYIYILSSVYNPVSDRVGLPLNNIPSPGVLMQSVGSMLLLFATARSVVKSVKVPVVEVV